MTVTINLAAEAMQEKSSSAQTIQFIHEDYPPYVYRHNGIVVGEIAQLAEKILGDAGYKIAWRQTNYSRLIRELELGAQPACAAGYSGQHQTVIDILASKPISWFPGAAIAIKKTDEPLFSSHTSIEDILKDRRLRGAFLNDVNYQGVTDELLQLGKDRHIQIGGSDRELGLLVARGRVHFAPINPAQTKYLSEALPSARNLVVFQPTGMRPPRTVGIICSKLLSPDVWRRINNAIEPLGPYAP